MSAVLVSQSPEPHPDAPTDPPPGEVLGTHTLEDRPRIVTAHRTSSGALLLIDTDAESGSDRRLVGHLESDEPSSAAMFLVRDFLARPPTHRGARPLVAADWLDAGARPPVVPPMGETVLWDREAGRLRLVHRSVGLAGWHAESMDGLLSLPVSVEYAIKRVGSAAVRGATERLLPTLGSQTRGRLERELRSLDPRAADDELDAVLLAPDLSSYRVAQVDGEVRWVTGVGGTAKTVRAVCGALQSYEPVVGMTRAAIRRGGRTARIENELADLDGGRTTLNRGLRERFLALAASDPRLTRSEVARRCGHSRTGGRRPDASWVARRLGLKPSSGEAVPTPWIDPVVLATIARTGLGVDPYEVELA